MTKKLIRVLALTLPAAILSNNPALAANPQKNDVSVEVYPNSASGLNKFRAAVCTQFAKVAELTLNELNAFTGDKSSSQYANLQANVNEVNSLHSECLSDATQIWVKAGRSTLYAGATDSNTRKHTRKTAKNATLSSSRYITFSPVIPAATGGNSVQVGANGGSFSFSSAYAPASNAKNNAAVGAIADQIEPLDNSAFNQRFATVWISGTFARSDIDGTKGDHGILYAGADYRINDVLKVGLLTQIDFSDQDHDATTSSSSLGWMVGPYASLQLLDSLKLEGRLAYGQASIDVDQQGLSLAKYDTQRFLATGQLTGTVHKDNWTINPFMRLTYFQEQQDAFTDRLGNANSKETFTSGRLDMGPKLTYHHELKNGVIITPELSLSGAWEFDAMDESTPNGDELFASLRSGLTIAPNEKVELVGNVFADGLGRSNYEVYGGSIRGALKF